MATNEPGGPSTGTARSPITVSDLAADLVWPRLLRAAGLALNPTRMGLAFFLVVILGLLGWLAEWVTRGEDGAGLLTNAQRMYQAAVPGAWTSASVPPLLMALFVDIPTALLEEYWYAFIPAMIAYMFVLVVFGGAISRSAASEYSAGVALNWPQALGFAARRWASLVLCLLVPGLFVWLAALGLRVAGWALLGLPVLNVIGSLAYVLFVLVGLAAALVMIAMALGKSMLIPAVVCEGTDALDAIQRVYAYVFGRLGRLLIYLLILALLGALAIAGVVVVVTLTVVFTDGSLGAWTTESGRHILELPSSPEKTGATTDLAHWIVRVWHMALLAIVGAYVLSYYFTAGTLLYLGLRRVHDGQDMEELWMPGMAPGTMAAREK